MSNEPRYPDLNEKSLGEQVAELKDYIVNLHRYIRYADNNIAERNLTRTLEDKINSYVDADGVIHILDELGFDSEVGFYNYVTFHNLQTEGETIINGDNITTGTILADYIDVDGIIAAKSIVVTDNLKDGSTVISGSNILTGTIDADYLDVQDIISTGSIIVAGADISDLNNDSGFITSGDIPDDLSDFNDDLGIVIETLPLYYRSTTQSVPTIDSSTAIGTSATTDDAWEYVMPRPKRGCYFYTCERFKKTDNSYTFSTVREIANASYTSLWCSSSDATYIDGGKIYANSVTATQVNVQDIISTGSIIVAGDDISDLNNDTGFITSSSLPTNLSDLNNDTGFITDAVDSVILVYKSAVSGTSTMAKPNAEVTDTTGSQNTWTTVRPQYSSSYPVLFVCWQTKLVSGTVSWTTPAKDETTTVIDGGHITTGTIDASQVTVTNIDADEINAGHVTAGYLDLKGLTIKDGQNNNTLTIDNNGNFWTSGAVENSIDYVDATATYKPTKANLINAANGYYVLKDGKWVLASDNVDWVNDNYSSLTVDDISEANANLLTKTITIDNGKLLWETTDANDNKNKIIEFIGEDLTAQGGLSTFFIDFYNYTDYSGGHPIDWDRVGGIYSLGGSSSPPSMSLWSTGDLIIQGGNDPSNKVNIVTGDLRINNNTIDFVIDEGTSNSWYYRIWNSGRMECWRRFSKTATAINTASGSLYTTSGNTTFDNYPSNFSAAPTVNMSLESAQGLMLAVTGTGTVSTPPSIKVMRTAAYTSSTTFYVDVYASGMKASS